MSGPAVSAVFERSTLAGTARLVLAVVASHASATGADAWPSIDAIAAEAGGVAPRTVKRLLAEAEAAGELLVYAQAGGPASMRRDRRPNRYELPLTPGWSAPAIVVDGELVEARLDPAGHLSRGDTTVTPNRPRGDATVTPQPPNGVTPRSPRDVHGVTSETPRGDISRPNGVTQLCHPSRKGTVLEPREGARGDATVTPWQAADPLPLGQRLVIHDTAGEWAAELDALRAAGATDEAIASTLADLGPHRYARLLADAIRARLPLDPPTGRRAPACSTCNDRRTVGPELDDDGAAVFPPCPECQGDNHDAHHDRPPASSPVSV